MEPQGRKEGDWYCLSCGDHQFKNNQECRTCKGPRTHSDAEHVQPELPDAETFINSVFIDDEKKAKFWALSPNQQRNIIAQGPLVAARDPTAVLASRLNRLPKDAAMDMNAPQGQYQSTVKRYNVHKGWGFINAMEAGQPDIFLHQANVVDGTTPLNDDLLTFDLEPAKQDGTFNATNVRGGRGKPCMFREEKGKKGGGKGQDDGPYGGDGKGSGKGGKGGKEGGKDMGYMFSMFTQFMDVYNKGWEDAQSKAGGGKGNGGGGWQGSSAGSGGGGGSWQGGGGGSSQGAGW